MELFNEPIIQKKTLSDVIKNDNVITNSTMVGGSFNGGKITIGSGNNLFTANKDGIFLGSSSFSTAPFRVDMAGNMTASSATISGDIESSNYTEVAPYTGYKLEYLTGKLYANDVVIRGGTIGGQPVFNVANASDSTALSTPTGLTIVTTGITTADDGTISSYATLSWNAVSGDTLREYKIRYKKGSFTYYQYISTTALTITIDELTPNTTYNFAICSVNKYGIESSYSSTVSTTTATNSIAPIAVQDVSATSGIQYVIVEWTNNSEKDIASYNVYRNTVNNSGTATLIANVKTNYFIDGGRTGGTEYFYWIKAVNTSGIESASFSTVKSATPRNVTSDDVVTLAGSKVLIDGTTYLSNWRNSTDLTKIDGGNIYTGTITTTQLNFTPVQNTNVIASINASTEGIKIDADNLTISAATTFSSGYDPSVALSAAQTAQATADGKIVSFYADEAPTASAIGDLWFDTNNNNKQHRWNGSNWIDVPDENKLDSLGGTYNSASSGARVRIFPDANTGIQVIDDATNDVFKCLVGGTDVGDVLIGDYAHDKGMFYDKSASTFTFKGLMSAGDITGVTITGGTIQTASNGQRVEIASSDNTLTFYNNDDDIITQLGGGDYIGTALRVNLDSSTTRGVFINSSQENDIGFIYASSGNYRSIGTNIQLTGATNTGTGVNINHDGSGGEGIFIDVSNGARPLLISNTGNGINIYSTGTGRNSDLFIFHDNINAMTPSVDIFSNSQGANIKLSKNSSGNPIGIDFNINSSYGGFAYMARFNGAEVASSAVSGTQNKKIRVLVGTSIYYIPLYDA